MLVVRRTRTFLNLCRLEELVFSQLGHLAGLNLELVAGVAGQRFDLAVEPLVELAEWPVAAQYSGVVVFGGSFLQRLLRVRRTLQVL